MQCPCGSSLEYTKCCGLYIDKGQNAPTPVQLMRSRYTAFTQANADYIGKTMKPPASNGFDPGQTKEWASKVKWTGLKVVKAKLAPGNRHKGWVEFEAFYTENGNSCCIHELSEFHFIDGKWYYVTGKHYPYS